MLDRGEILGRKAQRLEERQLVVRPTAFAGAGQHLAKLGPHLARADLVEGEQVVARLGVERFSAVGEKGGVGDRSRVDFTRGWDARPNGVDVRAWGQPLA